MSQLSDELGERLARIVPELEALDWDDVVERSQPVRRVAPVRRGGRLRIAPRVLLFVAIVVLMGGSLALAFGGRVLTVLAGPSMPAQVESLVLMQLRPLSGQTDATSDRIVHGSERRILSVHTSRGVTATLWTVRTLAGRQCYAAVGKPFGLSGCLDPAHPVPGPFGVLAWMSARHDSAHIGREMTLVGQVASREGRHVRLVYANGTFGAFPVVDGWFMLEVPVSHTTARTEPIRIDVLAGSGAVLAARSDPFRLHMPRPVAGRPIASTIRRLAFARLPNHGGSLAIWLGTDAKGQRCFRYTRDGAGKPYPWWICSPQVGRSAAADTGAGFARVPVQWTLGSARRPDRGTGYGYAYAVGWVAPSVERLVLRFEDGTSARVTLVGRDFLYVVPRAHWAPEHRPSELDAIAEDGSLIYRRPLDPGAHCVYPGPDPACAHVVTMDVEG
jgi:hypothetical protein